MPSLLTLLHVPRASLALAALVCLAGAAPLAAQPADDVDLVLRGVPADAALAAVAEATGLDVVYSSELVGDDPVWCGGAGWQADDLLRCITDAVGLDYARRSSGTYVVTERVVEPVQAGGVAGLVVDGETGAPLALAHVRLAGATTVTDADGRFALADVTPGPHVLLASYVGYRAQAVRLAVAPGAVRTETVGLRPAVARVGAVVIDGLVPRLASERLGADVGFEVLPDRVEGRAPARAETASLAGGAPAVTSSADGPALRPLLGVGGRTFRDGLSLQGGEPGEHALTLDGARIYEPLAIGPALGAMSPLAVGRVTVRKAGFGAETGSYLAGAVEAEHALASPPGGVSIAAEGDVYAASARLQHAARLGTLGGETVEATTLVAARRSLWDAVRPGALDDALRDWNSVDPVLASVLAEDATPPRAHYDTHRHGSELAFSDLHAATRLRVGALRSLRASLYRGGSDVSTELFAVGAPPVGGSEGGAPDPSASFLARDATRWTNTAATLRGDALVSPRWRLGGGARLSRHTLRQRYDALDGTAAGLDGTEPLATAELRLADALGTDLPDNGNALTELTISGDATVALGAGQELALGLEATGAWSRFHLLSAGFGEASFRDLDAEHGQARLATFAAGRHRLGARWTLEPGLRLTTLAASGDVFAEPRLALRYDAQPGDWRLPGTVAARLAAGVYRQFASRVELATFGPSALVPDVAVWLPTDGSVAPPSALHAAAEVLWQPSAAWAARVEGYAKALPRVYALDYRALFAEGAPLADQADFLLPEEGRSWGVGARLERQAPRWAASAGVALANAERRSDARFDGRWVPAPWAEPVRATLGLDVLAAGSRASGLLLRARGLGVWGRSWALRRAYYDVLPAVGTSALGAFGLGAPGSDRLAPLVTLDLGLAWTTSLAGARTELAVDVANALGRRNVLDWSLRPDAEGTLGAVTRTLPGAQPSLRLRVTL